MKRLVYVSLAAASLAMAAGYKIPEQSVNATALAAAYVSHTNSADTAYYNPANMVFLEAGRQADISLMGIYLSPITNDATGHETHAETFVLPQLHAVSEEMNGWRIGFSFTEPAGLAKRWSGAPEAYGAKKFELRVFEAAPSFAYRTDENFAIGAALRFVYADGIIETAESPAPSPTTHIEAQSRGWGYLVGASYRPFPEWGLAATYRSKVNLHLDGGVQFPDGYAVAEIPAGYSIPATLDIPVPATLSLATHVDVLEMTTLEFVFERNYWSSYRRFYIDGYMSQPVDKSWKDSNSYRLGLTHRVGGAWQLMAGFSLDDSPVPDETLGFELPDGDALIVSAGFRCRVNESTEVGLAYLYDKKRSRSVANANVGDTTFSGAAAHLISFGVGHRY